MNDDVQSLHPPGKPGRHPVWKLIVIDTDSVKAQHPAPSQNPNQPTAIGQDEGFMIVNEPPEISPEEETGGADISAPIGGVVHASATSGSHNFEDAVLLYDMHAYQENRVAGELSYKVATKPAIVPDSPEQPLSTKVVEQVFPYQAGPYRAEAGAYKVSFGLYIRDDNTGQPVLYGYFCWTPKEAGKSEG